MLFPEVPLQITVDGGQETGEMQACQCALRYRYPNCCSYHTDTFSIQANSYTGRHFRRDATFRSSSK